MLSDFHSVVHCQVRIVYPWALFGGTLGEPGGLGWGECVSICTIGAALGELGGSGNTYSLSPHTFFVLSFSRGDDAGCFRLVCPRFAANGVSLNVSVAGWASPRNLFDVLILKGEYAG